MKFTPSPALRLAACTLLMAPLLIGCGEKPEALLASAKSYLEKNDKKAAIIQIKNALQADPNLAEARYLLGVALLESGDAIGAEAELRKAIELNYPRDTALPQLAKTLLAQGQAKKVIEQFTNVHLEQPAAQASLQFTLAGAYAAQGQVERSDESLNASLQADAAFPPALLERARHMAGERNFEGAQALVAEVLAKTPKSPEAWKLKGDIHWLGQNLSDDALADYRQALANKPDYFPGHTALITLLLQQSNLDAAAAQLEKLQKLAPNHPRTQYLSALLAFQKKDFKSAREQLQVPLKTLPSNLPLLQLAGTTELQLNNLPQAQEYLGKALALNPALTLTRRQLVAVLLRSGQAAKALSTLTPALEQADLSPDLLALAGEVYLQNGDLAKSEEYFARSSAQAPQDVKKKTSLALVHLIGGATDSALDELRHISVEDSGVTADLALISAHMKRRQFDPALKAIDVLQQKQPAKALAPYLRARVMLAKQDATGARRDLERAVSLDPVYFPAVANLAALDLADQKPAEAKKRFEALLLKDPKNESALLALADLAAKRGAPPDEVAKLIGNAVAANPQNTRPRLLLVEYYLQRNDFKNASSAAQSAAAALPNDTQIIDALGRAQYASGDFNQTVVTYKRLTDLLPQSAMSYGRLAEAQMATKDNAAAGASLRKAIALQPDFLQAQRALIALHIAENKLPLALEVARSVQVQRPREEAGYVLEGDVNAYAKEWDNATIAYRAGLKQVSTTTLAMKLHTALQSGGKNADAERLAQSWSKDHPKDAAFAFYLGDRAMLRKDYSSAEKQYALVIKLQPDNAVALNNLAWVSGQLKHDGALAYAQRALALAPDQPVILDTLATLHSEGGNHRQAIEMQTKATQLQPRNLMLKFNLAKVYLKAGEKDLAKKTLDELASAGDAFPAQAEVTALYKQLNAPAAR